MIDRFLSAAYAPGRRELHIEKLAQQLSNLPTSELVAMARYGFAGAHNMEKSAAALRKYALAGPDVAGAIRRAGNAIRADKARAAKWQTAAARLGLLARHNTVPLATTAAGMATGAYIGGKDGGGLSGTLGGAVLGGLGGAALGKGGQLVYRAATAPGAVGGASGFARRLKGEVNADVQRTQRAFGARGEVWQPFKIRGEAAVRPTVASPAVAEVAPPPGA